MQWNKGQIPGCAGMLTAAAPVFSGFLTVSAPVHAMPPWTAHPTFSLEAGARDNVRLREDGGEDTYQGTIEIGAILQQVSQARFLLAEGAVGYTAYSGDPEAPDNNDFQSFLGQAGHRTERTVWRLTGTFLRDNALVDVTVPEDAVDPGADIDTVTASESVRRYRASIRPTVEYSLTQRLSVEGGYVGTYRSYDGDEQNVDRQELLNHEGEVRAGYKLSEITTVGAGFQASFFRPRDDSNARSVDTYALLADVEHGLSELSTIRVSGGVRQSEPARSGDDRDSETGFTGRIEGSTEGWNWRATAFVERRLLPDHRGELKETDQVILNMTRELTPRLEVGLSGRAFKTRSIEEQAGEADGEEYARLLPSLTYRFTPEWSVTGEYRFEFIRRAGNEDDAYGNSVFLSIDFVPRREVRGF